MIANWIAMFEYSKAHYNKPLSRKLQNGYLCVKSPYNALQILEHWVRHVCLWIVSLLFDFATRNLHFATNFYHLVAKWRLNDFVNFEPCSTVLIFHHYLRVSKNQLEVSHLKVFLKAFFKSAIGFFSAKAQTSTTDSESVKFIYMIVDQCICWGDYMITINFFFELSFMTQSNREGRNKSGIYHILSVELLKSAPSKAIFCCTSFCFIPFLLTEKTSTKYYRNPSFFRANSRLI